ncbi:MAG: hypothetical protein ACKOW8_11110, partial [Flavobacteriales bacterium]
GNSIYIAVSQTSNPTGSYFTYTFTSAYFPDYLKFGVWHDGYYMTSNPPQSATPRIYAFNRAAMIAGNATSASMISLEYNPTRTSGFFCAMPGCAADGILPPAGTPCPIFSYTDNAWGTGITDGVQIHNMTVNWATPSATISTATNVPTAAFDASYSPYLEDCPQPNTNQKLDGIGGIIMYRVQWKTWTTYNSVVMNWGVKINTNQRSIKWCELRQDKITGVWSLYQEGIYTPDSDTRWMGSICMDNNGGIGLSYLKSNSTNLFPSLYYTGRRSCDPLGTMPIAETLVAAGTGSQTCSIRVGDYAHTTLDPSDGTTFWSTSEFMGGATGVSAATTSIFSYSLPVCSNQANVSIAITSGSLPLCPGSNITFTATPINGGSNPSYQWKVNEINVGTNSPTYVTSNLANNAVVRCVMTSNLSGVTNNPASSNSITVPAATAVTPAVSITQTSGSNPVCSNAIVSFSAAPTNGGGTPSYQWRVNDVIAGSSFIGGTGGAASTTLTVDSGSGIFPGMTLTGNGVTPGTVILDQITGLTDGGAGTYNLSLSNTIAAGSSLKVNANCSTFASTLANNSIITCVMTATPSTCVTNSSATSNAITITHLTPAQTTPSVNITQTTGSSPICSGSLVTYTANAAGIFTPSYQWKLDGANVGTNSSTYSPPTTLSNGQTIQCVVSGSELCPTSYTLGTGNAFNGSNSGAAYPTATGNGRQQYVIRANDLNGINMPTGNI